MGMTDDQVTAYLGHVRALIETTQSKPGDTETEHAIVTDLFPGFVAAVEAALAALSRHQHKITDSQGTICAGCLREWPCPDIGAITAALTGKEAGDG